MTLNDSPNWIAVTKAGTYTASVWVRADTPGQVLKLKLREYQGSTLLAQPLTSVTLTTSWQLVTVQSAPVAPGNSTLDLTAYVSSAPVGATFYVDDVSITQARARPRSTRSRVPDAARASHGSAFAAWVTPNDVAKITPSSEHVRRDCCHCRWTPTGASVDTSRGAVVDFSEAFQRIVRGHWIILTVCVLLGIGVGIAVSRNHQATYTATTRVALGSTTPQTEAEASAISSVAQAIATSNSQVRDALNTAQVQRDSVRVAATTSACVPWAPPTSWSSRYVITIRWWPGRSRTR